MKRELICIVCPNSCRVTVDYEGEKINSISGAQCKKGKAFVQNEITNPIRTFAGSVLCKKGDFKLVSVKTSQPIAKKHMKQLGLLTHQIQVCAPIQIGQIIASNLFDEGIDLIATRKVNGVDKSINHNLDNNSGGN